MANSLKSVLVSARNATGLSQGEAAQRLGVHKSYLCRIEREQYRDEPGPDLLDRMIALYGADADAVYRVAGRIPEDVRALLLSDAAWFGFVRSAAGARS